VNSKVQNAVKHLNKTLPLAERKKKFGSKVGDVYHKILNSYVELGRTLNKVELAEHVENADTVINALRSNDMVVFDSNDEPIGAYPFTMEKRDHKVKVNNHTVHSMCAFDALAISPMFNIKTHIDSKCHVTGESISIDQFDQEVLNREISYDIHFGLNWNSVVDNCCATSLCTEMIFLKDKQIANTWLSEDIENREIFTIDEAINFASLFFRPLIN